MNSEFSPWPYVFYSVNETSGFVKYYATGQTHRSYKWLLCVPSGLILKKFYVLPKGYIYVPYGSEKKK